MLQKPRIEFHILVCIEDEVISLRIDCELHLAVAQRP